MSYIRLRLCTLAVFLTACGSPSPSQIGYGGSTADPIIDGEPCAVEDYPTAVAILIDATIQMFGTQQIKTVVCTGTLIAPDVVLTAAHCLDPTALTMGMGTVKDATYYATREPDLADLAQQATNVFPDDAIGAVGWTTHPSFSLDAFDSVDGPGNFYDIGLLYLEEPIEDIQPAVLIASDETEALVEGADVAIVGWGQQTAETNPFGQPAPGTVGVKVCATSSINELGDHEMQIGDLGPRKCHGDSGGPSYLEVATNHARSRRVVGITSHAYDMSDCAKGGVDTRVDTWLEWIETELSGACDDSTRVWCDVGGVIPPSYYDPPPDPKPDPEPEPEPIDPTDPVGPNGTDDPELDIGSPPSSGGCSSLAGLPVWAALIGLLIFWLRQRRPPLA